MADSKRKTKRKVDLVSSHSDRGGEDGPHAAHSTEGSPLEDLYRTDRIPEFMKYKPKEGEHLVEEEIYIPDVV